MTKHFDNLSPETIWSFRQNHPELVVRDLRDRLELDEEQCQIVRDSLMARGINKWLKVRRDLIAYKKQIKNQIAEIEHDRIKLPKHSPERKELLIRQNCLKKIRKDLKTMCMTERWQEWPTSVSKGLKQMNSIHASDRKDIVTIGNS